MTVVELARRSGRVVKQEHRLRRTPGVVHASTPEHKAAAALHGWKAHLEFTGEPMRLTHEDYEAAIAAANIIPTVSDGGPPVREPIPHQAALSEHCPMAFNKATCERVWSARDAASKRS